jgi:hypothetical protein
MQTVENNHIKRPGMQQYDLPMCSSVLLCLSCRLVPTHYANHDENGQLVVPVLVNAYCLWRYTLFFLVFSVILLTDCIFIELSNLSITLSECKFILKILFFPFCMLIGVLRTLYELYCRYF